MSQSIEVDYSNPCHNQWMLTDQICVTIDGSRLIMWVIIPRVNISIKILVGLIGKQVPLYTLILESSYDISP